MTESDTREILRSNVLDRVSDAVVSLNSDLEYTFANPQAEQLLDETEESLRGMYIWDAFPEGSDTVAEQQISEALETGQEQTFERYNEALDRWFEVRVYPDEGGVSIFFTDISERKERELELEQYEQVIEALPVAVGINTPGEEGRFEFVNQAAVDMFGASSKAELQDYSLRDTYATPNEQKQFSEQLRETGSVKQYEVQLTTLEDETFWGAITADFTEIGGTEYIIGIIEDVSERKEREQKLNRSQQIIENSTDLATIIDLDGTITYVSPAVERVLGYDPEELIGASGFRYQPEETQEAVADAIKSVLDNPAETKTVQTRFRRSDESWCWIESTLRNRLTDDIIDGILVSSREITERKEREQELQRQNSRLNEFANVVSHDLRNPLNVAHGRATILQQQGSDELEGHLDPLMDSLERMESIIEDTLTLARQGEIVGEMNSISFVDFIGKCWAGVETAEAMLEIDDELTIRGDRDRLRHVFENLFRNAVEHGSEDVTVRVGRAGENCIYVEDDGPGIPPDERDMVFEPGHTSAAGETGFGLTIVKRIAEAHGWEVTVTDGRDGGARFEFDTVGLVDE